MGYLAATYLYPHGYLIMYMLCIKHMAFRLVDLKKPERSKLEVSTWST